jgi:hypothetical protein
MLQGNPVTSRRGLFLAFLSADRAGAVDVAALLPSLVPSLDAITGHIKQKSFLFDLKPVLLLDGGPLAGLSIAALYPEDFQRQHDPGLLLLRDCRDGEKRRQHGQKEQRGFHRFLSIDALLIANERSHRCALAHIG